MVNAGGIYIAVGSNLGDRQAHILSGLRDLERRGDIRVLRRSKLHETRPAGGPPDQPWFLNAVAELATDRSPQELLARLLEVEQLHGRRRELRNGPRTLDLDLLLYRDVCLRSADLTVPHPRMWERDFVMSPLRELCDADELRRIRAAAVGAAEASSRPNEWLDEDRDREGDLADVP